jgi:hypothetical protein
VLIYPQIRYKWVPEQETCVVLNPQSSKLNIISILVTDVSLLIIMLAGLFRLRSRRDGTSGLGHLLWKQVSFWTVVVHSIYTHALFVRELFGSFWPLLPRSRQP